ncbi:efflux RND transporter periplasmic adaptor subunit [Rivularia sp. UHCC 0363]|uniref:efflux RND transporter periplasmic adaptor subunit n=1 Tax=Rivularia sp. UHCC 0363 TaxID=3110244 RepID=UPI002B210C23|nr:efflux RND transporter periplasmic adaptor subunit [Rivularia sp. UHCC 0363]MEA5594095.1 efflux RND transporter periplasmic adaptor subunit [Rivularia sp. UHCC 0363]
MVKSYRSQQSTAIRCIFGTFLSLSLLAPLSVMAHAGHGDEFQSGSDAAGTPSSVQVDIDTANRLGIKVEPAKKQRLDIGIKTTGQIETLPDQRVEVTAPLTSKVVELLVKPGSKVKKGQTVAVIASPELVELRVGSQEKQADAQGELQKAQADLKLAQENLDRQQKISDAEIAQTRSQLAAATAQYNRDLALVNQRGVLKVAQENLKRQRQIAAANVAQTTIEVAVAQEQYDRDRELVEKGALPRRQMLESQAKLSKAKAELARAKSSPEVVQAESEVKKAEVDLPLRELRDSQSRVAEVQTQLKRAIARRDVLEAQAQLKRAQSDVKVANSRINSSNTTYNTRLQQLGTTANAKGLITITAPIDGIVADREVNIGQSLQDAGGKLMTIINDNQVFATANIYEKDLDKVKTNQKVIVKVASLPDITFAGKISRIGSVVEGETRIVPVQAEINNPNGQLKPGMFAELEVLTDKTEADILVIPNSAVVDVNGKKTVYVQNGNAFQPTEVSLGQTTGNMVEVKAGLFEGDMIVTQRAPQLYAQSLRGGSAKEKDKKAGTLHTEVMQSNSNSLPIPLLLITAAGGSLITILGVVGGNFLRNRRKGSSFVAVDAAYEESTNFETEAEIYLDDREQVVLVSDQPENKI